MRKHFDDLEANGDWRDVLNRMDEICCDCKES